MDTKSFLNQIGMEGLVISDSVDTILVNTLVEDLRVMPVCLNGSVVYLPGPELGLNRMPVYVLCGSKNKKNKPVCKTLADIVESTEGASLNATMNIVLLNMFKQINDVKNKLINDENHVDAYELIRVLEQKLNKIKVYYGSRTQYHEVDNEIMILKRKMEIENTIFNI